MNPSNRTPAAISTNLEDYVVTATLFAVGGLGILLGLLWPACKTEMALGLVAVLFGLREAVHEVRRARRHGDQLG